MSSTAHPSTTAGQSQASEPLDALVVAPHPDDAELGMGGTIVRLIQQGWKIGILDLTDGEPTPLGSRERRAAETASANAALGSPWRKNLGLPNRSLEPTLLHRRAVAAVFREMRPRLIFAPSGKMRTPITPLQPSSSKTHGSGASFPNRTSRASRFTRREFSTISASISELSSVRAWSWTFPNRSMPSWPHCGAFGRSSSIISPRAARA